MPKIVIFGNSGSGKTTLAKKYAEKYQCTHLDLDTLAWLDTQPPTRQPIDISHRQLKTFTNENKNWIIEGCYADLLAHVIDQASEIIFLNPGTETCIKNCYSRPWEPHKYKTVEEQDKNLVMLINWIKNYDKREDEFSLKTHALLFQQFSGKKTEYQSNIYLS
jgi:adenylate kinase family enzyme